MKIGETIEIVKLSNLTPNNYRPIYIPKIKVKEKMRSLFCDGKIIYGDSQTSALILAHKYRRLFSKIS